MIISISVHAVSCFCVAVSISSRAESFFAALFSFLHVQNSSQRCYFHSCTCRPPRSAAVFDSARADLLAAVQFSSLHVQSCLQRCSFHFILCRDDNCNAHFHLCTCRNALSNEHFHLCMCKSALSSEESPPTQKRNLVFPMLT